MNEIIDAIPTNWSKVIKLYPNLKDIETFLEKEKNKFGIPIFPQYKNIFKCFHYFNTGDTKVVILGQDPYHGKDQAIGLCFGVSKTTKIVIPIRRWYVKKDKIDITGQVAHGIFILPAKDGIN